MNSILQALANNNNSKFTLIKISKLNDGYHVLLGIDEHYCVFLLSKDDLDKDINLLFIQPAIQALEQQQ